MSRRLELVGDSFGIVVKETPNNVPLWLYAPDMIAWHALAVAAFPLA